MKNRKLKNRNKPDLCRVGRENALCSRYTYNVCVCIYICLCISLYVCVYVYVGVHYFTYEFA